MKIACDTLEMSISKYTYFKDDVYQYMNELIHMYDFDIRIAPDSLWDLQLYLINEKCKIFLNPIYSYPTVSVAYDVYQKNNNNEFSTIYKFNLFLNYGFNEKEYNKYLSELNATISDPDKEEFAGYRRALIIAEKMILKYYMPVVFPNK